MRRLFPGRGARSETASLDLSIRGSLYSLSLVELVLIPQTVQSAGSRAVALVAVATALHAALAALALRSTLGQALGGPPASRRVLAWFGVASLLLGVLLWSLATPEGGQLDYLGAIIAFVGSFTLFPLCPLLDVRRLTMAAGAVWAASALAFVVVDALADELTVALLMTGAWLFFLIVVTGRMTCWMLMLVWELDAARKAQSQLAVAEERLRFSRDLHDVVGRTLSLVAVKSELAAKLARRGRPDAVDQMLEVQQIAQDSLREVRAVAHGYRTADLGTEVAGARSLLRSAGIDARADVAADHLDETTREALAWVVREGTTNVVRHSDATWCVLTLVAEGEDTVLTISNDGLGETAPGRPGSGLTGLRERLAAVGGAVAGTRDGSTFVLTARVPGGARTERPAPEGGSVGAGQRSPEEPELAGASADRADAAPVRL